jgi:hypothetical protein
MFMKRLWLAFLALPVLTAAASEAWTNRLEIPDRHALATFDCRWTPDGLKLQLVGTNHAAIEVRLAPGRRPDLRFLPARLFPEGIEDAVQVWPSPPAATNAVTCALRRQSHAWMLCLDDRPVARLPEPWAAGSVVVRHPLSALPAGRDERYVQRTAAFRFEDNFLVPKGEKGETPALPETWERRSGDWSLHCVTGMVSGTVRQLRLGRQPTPEHSPNFYSLEGRGSRAVALTGESFQHRYACRASVQHNGGTNGLLFLVTEAGACLGFTARTDPATECLVFDLWRGGVDSRQPRETLATVGTELLAGQWTLMEARVFDDRVACLADNIEILRRRLPLPPGGRFGLYADSAEGTRFDDVAVLSHEEYPFDSAADLRFHALRCQGPFRTRARDAPLAPAGGDPMAVAFEVPGGREAREWVFGAADDGPHKLEICADAPAGGDWSLALLAGWQSPSDPGFRFVCRQVAGRRLATLERADGPGGRTVLDAADLGPAVPGPLRLTLDALRPGELRGLVNGRLAVLDRPPADGLRGAAGVRLEGRERIRLSLPLYASSAPVYADRFEKNPAYVNDPFMRNWSSPEGQWITMPDGLTWLRGDVMGRVKVRLPAVEGSVLHLAIPEDGTNGACRVALRGGRLCAYTPAGGTGAVFAVAVTNVPEERIENVGSLRLYTVNLEDDLLWLSCDAGILGRCHLPPLPKGRRVRIEGMDLAGLRQTLVRRENVFDTLFNESLHGWTVNGGTWEIVNRFACEPSWSHMNGENGEGFAGLWSKVEVAGDFCAELYAGTRMGWYERPGDFNLTVASRRNATCDGYSLTTAGWDPDWSQLYSRLFRNGATCAVSTAYTAPRVRDGSRREGYEPLVPKGGRDVHGAWYGVRFRRVGDRLSAFFDNEPVLAWRDPAPLAAGSLGLWTYRNSIMIARIRIAAETIRPRPFRFWTVAAPAAAADAPAAVPGLRVNGRPAEWLDPAVWTDADPVSRPLIRFGRDAGGRPEMTVTALGGGGSFLAAPRLPPLPAGKLLGWRFEIARHPEARVNFEFSAGRRAAGSVPAVGTVGATGVTTPAAQLEDAAGYSFAISGSDDPRGARRIAGRLDAPPPSSPPAADDRSRVWTAVEVWLPTELLRSERLVVVDGFGNLQPSDLQQGLAGNPPGAWYAVRNFREVYNGLPEFDGPAAVRPELDAFSRACAALPPGRLHERRLPAALDSRAPAVAWAVRPEAEFGLVARLDERIPDALRVTSVLPWPSPLLPARGATLDGAALSGWQEGNDYIALLPRGEAASAGRSLLALELADGRTFRQSVPLPAATGRPPVLVECEMPAGGLQTFEQRPVDPQRHLGRAGFALACTDPQQGTFIRFQNSGLDDGRLDGRVLPEYDPVCTPLLQFRYKADPMAHVSLAASRCNIAFSEEGTGVPVAPGATGVLDNAWHTWAGMPLRAAGSGPLRQGCAVTPGELRVASRGGRDQTGRYSAMSFDDIAAGPAVGPRQPLALRLHYSSRAGVAEVRYAVVPGPAPWSARDDAERAAARWIAVTNLQPVTPDLSGLPEGAHHFVTRARDAAGAWSADYDLPFLLDRQPPVVTHALRDVPDRYNGTCLGLAIQGGFAPPVVRNLRFTCDGKPLDLGSDNGTFNYAGAEVGFEIDWPWLLRKARKDRKDGDTLTIVVDGIADAAGNEAPAYTIPIRLSFANDKQPPAVNPPAATTNLLAWSPQFKRLQDFFNTSQHVSALEAQQENGFWFVPFRNTGGTGAYLGRQSLDRPWDVEAFPWLALSVRLEGEGVPAGTNAPFALRLRPHNLPEGAVKPKDGTSYVWDLPTADGQRFILGRADWRPGRWNDVLINVRDLLRAEAGTRKAPSVRQLDLAFPPQARFTIQIRGCAILAPWGAADALRFQAYDLSGVAGLAWQNGGKCASTGLRPARVALPPDDARWLKLRVADRVGNLSPVFMVPLPPPAAPIPETLPLEVDVENH